MLIAGVSTVLFNGNPLLRYDGYYILADLLEIPNLAQRATRYWGHLVERYVFRTRGAKDFVATAGERVWLFLYAPASFLYRQCGDAGDRDVHRLAVSGRRRRHRDLGSADGCRAAGRQGAVAGDRGPALSTQPLPRGERRHSARCWPLRSRCCFIPAPLHTRRPKVWSGCRRTPIVRAGTDGFVRRLLVEPGNAVKLGEALVESEEPTLERRARELAGARRRARGAAGHRAVHRPRARRRSRPPSWGRHAPSWRPQTGAPSG